MLQSQRVTKYSLALYPFLPSLWFHLVISILILDRAKNLSESQNDNFVALFCLSASAAAVNPKTYRSLINIRRQTATTRWIHLLPYFSWLSSEIKWSCLRSILTKKRKRKNLIINEKLSPLSMSWISIFIQENKIYDFDHTTYISISPE